MGLSDIDLKEIYGFWHRGDFRRKFAKKMERGEVTAVRQNGQDIRPGNAQSGLVEVTRASGTVHKIWIWGNEYEETKLLRSLLKRGG